MTRGFTAEVLASWDEPVIDALSDLTFLRIAGNRATIFAPLRSELDAFLEHYENTDTTESIKASEMYAELHNGYGGISHSNPLPHHKWLSAHRFVRLWELDGGVFLSKVVDDISGSTVLGIARPWLVESSWLLDVPVGLDELSIIQRNIHHALLWSEITVGEFATMVALDRGSYENLGGRGVVAQMEYIDIWRSRIQSAEALFCSLIVDPREAQRNPEWFDIMTRFDVRTVAPFVPLMSSQAEPSMNTLIKLLDNGVDPAIMETILTK
jgi:hypothetical protein